MDVTTTTTTTTTFTLFPQLPPEIRLKIWRQALPLFPRVLELSPVRWNDTTFPETLPLDYDKQPKWSLAISATSPLLNINIEARIELLPLYLNFQAKGVAPSFSSPNPHDVPFCPYTDTLFVNVKDSQKIYDGTDELWEEVFGVKGKEMKKSLRKLAGSRRFWEDGSADLVSDFASLEESILVVSSKTLRTAIEHGMGTCYRDDGGMLCLDTLYGTGSGKSAGQRGIEMRVCVAADLEE